MSSSASQPHNIEINPSNGDSLSLGPQLMERADCSSVVGNWVAFRGGGGYSEHADRNLEGEHARKRREVRVRNRVA